MLSCLRQRCLAVQTRANAGSSLALVGDTCMTLTADQGPTQAAQ